MKYSYRCVFNCWTSALTPGELTPSLDLLWGLRASVSLLAWMLAAGGRASQSPTSKNSARDDAGRCKHRTDLNISAPLSWIPDPAILISICLMSDYIRGSVHLYSPNYYLHLSSWNIEVVSFAFVSYSSLKWCDQTSSALIRSHNYSPCFAAGSLSTQL